MNNYQQNKLVRIARQGILATMIREPVVTRTLCVLGVILVTCSFLGISLIECAMLELTGLPCPGCGLTRSVMHTLTGDIPEAIRYHAFGPFATVAIMVLLTSAFLSPSLRNRMADKIEPWEKGIFAAGLVFLLLLLYWIARILAHAMGWSSLDHL